MANIAIFRINYKSDFILTLNSDAGWLTPFCIKFWTGAPSQAYFVGFDGTTYTHCAPVDGEPTKLLVQFDDHHLPIGDLKFQIGYHFTVADFPTSIEDEVINQAAVIIDNDGEQQQVMLDFNGETAPEIEFSLPAYANEAQRIANESQRIANEEQRIATETQRIANEEQRISQEQTRQQNEVQRIVQEQARVTAERERFNDYAKLKVDAIAATDAANSAAALANEKAQLAADNAQLAADKAALAQSASALATEKAQLATDKAALAQSAATLANEKAALAQQKAEYATAQGDYAKAQGDYAKAQAGVIPTDVTRTQTDATFVNGNHDPLFYLRQANSSLAGLMTAAGYTKLNDMPSAQEVNAGLAYDVSVLHPTSGVSGGSTYASLSAALAVIPQDKRKGGMTVKFVLSFDNNYVQYFYTGTAVTGTPNPFLDVTNWEKINLEEEVSLLEEKTDDTIIHTRNLADKAIRDDSHYINSSSKIATEDGNLLIVFPCMGGTTYTMSKIKTTRFRVVYCEEYPNSGVQGYGAVTDHNATHITITTGENAKYLAAWVYNSSGESVTKDAVMASLQIELGSQATDYISPEWTAKDVEARAAASKLREDVDIISNEMACVDSSLNEKTIEPTFHNGEYIYTSGAVVSNANYKYGTFNAQRGDIVVVNVPSNSGGCVIGIKKNLTETYFNPVVLSNNQTQYIYVCEFDCIVGFSGLKDSLTCRVISSRIDRDLQGYGTPYATKRIFPQYSVTDGKYITTSGAIATLSGYAYTSPILMKKGTSIILNTGNVSSLCSTLSEVSEGGNFIRSLYNGDGVEETKYYQIDKTGYYAICCRNDKINYFAIIEFANGDLFFNNPLDHLFLNMVQNAVPPREILRSPSFVGIVHKWGFIGDSLSSGEQAVYEDGTTNLVRTDKYDYSWGQRMCALNSVDGYNFSVGGQTTKGWCNGAGEREWGGAQLEANWKQAYCIALGVNDRSASYPVGDADTDIDLTNYNNNADTFAGWYAGIIQRLRSVNPKCRIFCITIPYNNQQGYLDNNEIIRAIVPKFSNCYLVDLANYHWTPNGLALNDHLSPAGYQWAAWEINTYIDWIIRNNMNDFRDIAFVGTDYSADIQ